MHRNSVPTKLDHGMVKFGTKVRLNTPLTPFSANSLDSTKLSTFTTMLPSPRTNQDVGNMRFKAIMLGIVTLLLFIYHSWTLVICRLLPPSANAVIQWFQNDHYYCYLIPVLWPAFFFFMLVNWMGMKYFRHN